VERGRAPCGPDRGGGGIQTARPAVAGLAAATAAFVACLGLAAYSVATADRYVDLVAAPGIAAVLILLVGLVARWPGAIAWTLALLGTAYAASVAVGPADTVDGAAPLYATGLLVVAELAYWSLELRGARREDARSIARRLAALGVLAFLSLVLGSLVVLATAVPIGGGLALDLVGVAAAASALAVVAVLARRSAQG
jgi:hypothetical protein